MNTLRDILKHVWPHALIVALFVALSCVYFAPVLQGKTMQQGDDIHAKGAAQELLSYQKETGEYAQWTNSMFGGMPAYQIKSDSRSNIYRTFNNVTRLGLPYTTIAIMFLYLLGFYVLMCTLGLDKWVAAVAAMAFALGSYNIIIIQAGHITKCYAIALCPVVIAGVLMVFRNRLLSGGILTAVGLGMQLAYNHVQITYYLALTLMVMGIAYFVYAIREKNLASFGMQVAVLAGAAVLAVMPSATNLLTTQEYAKYSIRGAQALSVNKEANDSQSKNTDDGLEYDYTFAWSYGLHETPTLLVPNAVGGASGLITDREALAQVSDPQMRQVVEQQVSAYWGGRSFTSGPVYVGAIVCMLFFLGCFFYEGKEKWWLIAATVFSIMLGWGSNLKWFADLMYYYFPMYNKFRTVEMALVIATITIPLLGFLGLKTIWEAPEKIKYNVSMFAASIALSGGVAFLLWLAPGLFYDFLSAQEEQMFGEMMAQNPAYGVLRQSIIDVRSFMTREDAMRSVMLIMLASSALWFCSVNYINRKIALAAVALLIFCDMWSVDKRYLNSDHFTRKSVQREMFTKSEADKAILNDLEPHRVMSLYSNPFNEVNTSYFHQSVGGYHGAKLRCYQDVIDHYMSGEFQQLRAALQSQDVAKIHERLKESVALNMLNTKYLIYNPQAQPIMNPYAYGAAWFADSVAVAKSADEAIELIGKLDLSHVAVVEGKDLKVEGFDEDNVPTVEQTGYKPDEVRYETQSSKDGFVVLSEIYYPAGWVATVDGKEVEILKTDYTLRGVQVPAGRHEIVMSFRPNSYTTGNTISYAGSALVVILLVAALFVEVKKRKKEQA